MVTTPLFGDCLDLSKHLRNGKTCPWWAPNMRLHQEVNRIMKMGDGNLKIMFLKNDQFVPWQFLTLFRNHCFLTGSKSSMY